MKHGLGIGLALLERVAAHDDAHARQQAERIEQRLGQPSRLVGDDSERHALAREGIERLGNAGEQGRMHCDALPIQIQVAPEQRVVPLRQLGQRGAHDRRAAVAHRGRDLLVRDLRAAELLAQRVRGADEIGSRVRERAVEIEQHQPGPRRRGHAGLTALAR